MEQRDYEDLLELVEMSVFNERQEMTAKEFLKLAEICKIPIEDIRKELLEQLN